VDDGKSTIYFKYNLFNSTNRQWALSEYIILTSSF
jgi:hypothetical protein